MQKSADFFKFCRNVAEKKLEIFNFSDLILVLILFNFHIGVTPKCAIQEMDSQYSCIVETYESRFENLEKR